MEIKNTTNHGTYYPDVDSVLITLLSTTTVNIIGLGLIILVWHFYTKRTLDDKRI